MRIGQSVCHSSFHHSVYMQPGTISLCISGNQFPLIIFRWQFHHSVCMQPGPIFLRISGNQFAPHHFQVTISPLIIYAARAHFPMHIKFATYHFHVTISSLSIYVARAHFPMHIRQLVCHLSLSCDHFTTYHICKLLLYADDSTILFSHKDPDQIANKLGKVLESCSEWLVDNKLSLHLGKTECILFGSKRKLRKVKDFHIVCNDHTIDSTTSVKYLGLNIDNILSGEIVVNSIISKVNARLKFLYRQSNCLSAKTRKNLCSALILCHFDYSCSSWYAGLNKGLKRKLQISQNKVIRFINQLGPRTRITSDILMNLNLLNVETRVKQLDLLQLVSFIPSGKLCTFERRSSP